MNFFKRTLSLFLSMIIGISAVSAISVTTSAATKEDVYTMELPRAEDKNQEGWGHAAKQYLNGWETHETEFITVKSVESFEGPSCYCIEPGVSIHTGDTLSKKTESFWDDYPSKYNKTIEPDRIKTFIGRILQYGWTGNNSLEWVSTNEKRADECAQYLATQLLIWETVVGERDESFEKVDASEQGKDNIREVIKSKHPLREKIFEHYRDIAEKVRQHTVVPSFAARSYAKAKTVELEWNGKEYTATLTDSNDVLEAYSFSASGLSFSKSGKKLTITADTAPSSDVKVTIKKTAGKRKAVITWSDSVISPDSNQVQDVVTYGEIVTDPVTAYLKIKVSEGSCKIVKTSEDGNVANISFSIKGNGVNKTVKTDSNGLIQIDNLAPGNYTVTEETLSNYEKQESKTVTVVSGKTATVIFNNKLKRGSLKVTKMAEDGLNEGVKFHLYGTSQSGARVDEYATTGNSGVAEFKNVLIGSNYTLAEVDTNIRYVVPENQTATVEWNKVTNKSFVNTLKKFTVTVTKKDEEKITAQGDAKLSGAKYGIYKGDKLIDTYTTDADGKFTTKEYICGNNWTIKEIEPSEGYLLDTTVHTVGAETKNYTVEHNTISLTVTEQVLKGNIAIIKHSDNGDTQIETPEKGAEFQIYLKSKGSYEKADKEEKDVLVCDENGFSQSKDLPYGTYTVHQTKGLDGRELMKDFDVFICKDGQTYSYLINNSIFESYVKVVKKDAETEKTIPYAGAGFQLYDTDGNLVTMKFTYPTVTTIDTFYTDSNGTLITPEVLVFGKGYKLVEVQAPYGYALDSTPVAFDITESNSSSENGVTVVKVEKSNTAQKGVIEVTKTGEVFYSVNCNEENGGCTFVYEEQNLVGAKFEIYSAEDIVTPDGTVRYEKGTLVDTITTSAENGNAVSKDLYLGKYIVKETEAPYGYALNKNEYEVELSYAGQDVKVTSTALSVHNERQKVELSLNKQMQKDEVYNIGNNNEYKSVQFGLYLSEEIISGDGTKIDKDTLITTASPDESGNVTFDSDLPIGYKFYVKEIATDEHYILNKNIYEFETEYKGQDTGSYEIKLNEGNSVENKLKLGSVSGKKNDENGNLLSGALIGIFASDNAELKPENAIATAVTLEDGSFSFVNVPYGVWYIREITAPKGYLLNETVYEVNITENEQIVEIEIVDNFIRGNISLTKVDKDYPDNKLTGAVFEVFEDSNKNGVYDKDIDLPVGNLIETEEGIYTMFDLIYGQYFVKETKAPKGFVLDEGVYPVFISEHLKTYTVENKEGVGFINECMKGILKIIKTSSDGNVKGFSFRVTGPDGYEKTFKTDKDGIIKIKNLRIGKYTVSEVVNEKTKGYILPYDQTVKVKYNKTACVNMHNKEFIVSPKTGDEGMNKGFLFGLLAIALGGAIASTIMYFKSKKEDE